MMHIANLVYLSFYTSQAHLQPAVGVVGGILQEAGQAFPGCGVVRCCKQAVRFFLCTYKRSIYKATYTKTTINFTIF